MTKNKKEEFKIDFKYNLSLYLKYALKYKLVLILLFSAVFLVEAGYVADKFIFKFLIDNGERFSSGILAVDIFIKILLGLAAAYLVLIVARAALKLFQQRLVAVFETEIMRDLKEKFFNHLIHLDHEFHTTHKSGALISKLIRISSATERLSDVMIWQFAPMLFQLIVVFFSVAYFSLAPAIVTLVTIVVFIGYSYYMQRISEHANIDVNETEDVEKANIADIFTNLDSIRYYGKEKNVKQRYAGLAEITRSKTRRLWNFFGWLDSIQALILSLGVFVIMYFSIKQFLIGAITLGTLVFIYTTFASLVGYLFMFVHGIRGFYRSMAEFESIFKFNKIGTSIKDKLGAKPMKIGEGIINFDNVTFGYGKRRLFDNFNLKIPKNKKVALVGHSGCGKSTLVKLLYRLYDVESGKILIDNQNINDIKQESLREEMSIVPQEAILFDDTIYNNIKFANQKAKRKEVLQAIKFAQLDKIIARFSKKENTIVGERGVRLSGGEKQRVSIARAILANKQILVLDEATSALDSETEHEIQKDLEKLMKGRTSIIIAHRLSTIMNADMIVVMKEGKIVQKGSHRELITEGGEYQRLWDFQRGGYVE